MTGKTKTAAVTILLENNNIEAVYRSGIWTAYIDGVRLFDSQRNFVYVESRVI